MPHTPIGQAALRCWQHSKQQVSIPCGRLACGHSVPADIQTVAFWSQPETEGSFLRPQDLGVPSLGLSVGARSVFWHPAVRARSSSRRVRHALTAMLLDSLAEDAKAAAKETLETNRAWRQVCHGHNVRQTRELPPWWNPYIHQLSSCAPPAATAAARQQHAACQPSYVVREQQSPLWTGS